MENIWQILSAALLLTAFLWSVLIHGRLSGRTLSGLQLFTAGVFVAGVLFFVPLHRAAQEGAGFMQVLSTLVLSLTDGMRLFVLDIDPEALELSSLWRSYLVFLCFLAPVLTFTNVLLFFGSFAGALRLRFCVFRRVFIMSELTVQSLSLAADIRSRSRGILMPLMVFANAPEEHPLREQARQLGGLCLKGGVCDLQIACVGRAVEFFLLAEEETVNVSCAVQLRQQHSKKHRAISVYVYASAPYADSILEQGTDSGVHLHKKFVRWLKENPEAVLADDSWMDKKFRTVKSFLIRRLDPVELLVKEVLTMDGYSHYKKIIAAGTQKNTVSIAVLGMGRYGLHFLKTGVWFYQKKGCRVRLDVFDMGTENGDAESRLRLSCPELFTKNRAAEQDEAQYDIRFHKGVDCLGADFGVRVAKELKNTDLAFVALGDDETNIQTAIALRTLFDRQGRNKEENMPCIYAVIYDDMKLSNLHEGKLGVGAGMTEKDRKHCCHIHFVGTLATQYSYAAVENFLRKEHSALKWHLDWARKERQLHWMYNIGGSEAPAPENVDKTLCRDFKQALDEEEENVQWYDDGMKDPQDPTRITVDPQKVERSVKLYFGSAYHRSSSIAKAEHKEALFAYMGKPEEHPLLCRCAVCEDRRITEHMRWNAYMRTQGYIEKESGGKDLRAKLHPDLKPWHAIPIRERYKD